LVLSDKVRESPIIPASNQSGPQSPIQPQRLAAPEDVARTASREFLPSPAGDDFGLFLALAWAIPAGAAIWAVFFWLVA
jgi:hypothetical protein